MYVGGDGILLYEYMRDVVEAVCAGTSIFDLGRDSDPGFLSRVVQPGDLVLVRGIHAFRSLGRHRAGPGQACSVRIETDGVGVAFTLDRWEAVATSSWSSWLSGRREAASIVRVAEAGRSGDRLELDCTGIATGSALKGLSTLDYHSASWPEPSGLSVGGAGRRSGSSRGRQP